MTDMIEIIKNMIDAILREASDYVRNILSKVEDDFNEWKEKYIMLEYAEKIDELLDDACNKLICNIKKHNERNFSLENF